MTEEPIMTTVEVAEFLRVKPRWVLDHAATGEIPSFKHGKAIRYRRSQIELWVDSHSRGVQAPARHLQAIGGN